MSLSTVDVCAIIKACGEAGVRRLSFDGLRLSLEKPSSDPRPPTPNPWEIGPGPSLATPSVPTPTAPEHSEIEKDTLEADELAIREAQMAELWITNPLRAEELISSGELTGNGQIDGSDEE